jgi:hypothetical protein
MPSNAFISVEEVDKDAESSRVQELPFQVMTKLLPPRKFPMYPSATQKLVLAHETPSRTLPSVLDAESEAKSSRVQELPFQVSSRFFDAFPLQKRPTATQKLALAHETLIRKLSSVLDVESEAESSRTQL